MNIEINCGSSSFDCSLKASQQKRGPYLSLSTNKALQMHSSFQQWVLSKRFCDNCLASHSSKE